MVVNGKPLLQIPSLQAPELILGDNLDVLIGMDIIGQGDFAITKDADNNTVLSFAIPGKKEIDFVPEVDEENISGMNRQQRRALGIK